MTTAHRPTFNPSRGGGTESHAKYISGSVISQQYSSRDLPGHLKMKMRQDGQATEADLEGRDLKAELEAREREKYRKLQEEKGELPENVRDMIEERKPVHQLEDARGGSGDSEGGTLLASAAPAVDEDILAAFDDSDEAASDDEGSTSGSDDSDEEEAELQRELERIRREREQEQEQKAREEAEKRRKEEEEDAYRANPLLRFDDKAGKGTGPVMKRRWNEDVVFRNQARDVPQTKKRFINDTIRNDFHRAFLQKYIK